MKQIEQSYKMPLIDKENFLKSLQKLRYEYIEDIPQEKIIPYETPGWDKYKCRTNYFNSISLKILLLQQAELITNQETKQKCEDFLTFCKTIEGNANFYQQNDLDRANDILDCLIKELS